jgi:CRISPR-associated protein Cas6
MPIVDVIFPVNGNAVPVDHGYALFSALSGALPWLHERPDIGVFNVRGRLTPGGTLQLSHAHLRLRAPTELLGELLALAGRQLRVGDSRLLLGAPTARPLTSPPVLMSRLVTIKKFIEQPGFTQAVQRHLLDIGCEGRVEVGRRRVVFIAGRKIVGFQVRISQLSPAHSIRLQERGLGGRRHMGCGLFLPTRVPLSRDRV